MESLKSRSRISKAHGKDLASDVSMMRDVICGSEIAAIRQKYMVCEAAYLE